jgi:hypothetical protein
MYSKHDIIWQQDDDGGKSLREMEKTQITWWTILKMLLQELTIWFSSLKRG